MQITILLVASTAALAAAQPAASNTSSVAHSSSITILAKASCTQPGHALGRWWYNTWSDGPYGCYGQGDGQWSMLNAYRAGGQEGVHWKYTNNPNDGDCMVNWDYYADDGRTYIGTANGRITTMRDSRSWCALPVYRSGGIQNIQWGYCDCPDIDSVGGV